MPRRTVLCIGNALMGDDGAGAAVARALRSRTLSDQVELVEHAAAEMGLLKYFMTSDEVLVVDGIDAGAEPGAVFRFTPDQAGITSMRSNNLHGMGVGALVASARLSGVDPRVIVYGIQVGDVRPNDGVLTMPVRHAVDFVADSIEREVRGP